MSVKSPIEPEVTPSILANIPDTLRTVLSDSFQSDTRNRKSVLISSNSLANRFILNRWGIRPSQRRRYKNLYSSVRKNCRDVFQNYLSRGRVDWDSGVENLVFGVFKFDDIRGNLILGFVEMTPESEWTLSKR